MFALFSKDDWINRSAYRSWLEWRNSLVWRLSIIAFETAFIIGTLIAALFQITDTVFGIKELFFFQKISEGILYTVLVVTVTAVVMGCILVRTLIQPLKALTQAAQSLSMGKLDQEVHVTSQDEIGVLAAAFNRMAMKYKEKQEALEAMHLAAAAQSAADPSHREVETAYSTNGNPLARIT